jgi:hypothetical protein
MAIAVLLYNGEKGDTGNASRAAGYAIKAESFQISYSKTPIQVPLPEESPLLIDLGMYRPSITIAGLVDNEAATGASVTLAGGAKVRDRQTGESGDDATGNTADDTALTMHGVYSVPDKNQLEDYVQSEVYSGDNNLSLLILDPTVTHFNYYRVAPQQAAFILAPGTEDRYQFSMTFVASKRNEI